MISAEPQAKVANRLQPLTAPIIISLSILKFIGHAKMYCRILLRDQKYRMLADRIYLFPEMHSRRSMLYYENNIASRIEIVGKSMPKCFQKYRLMKIHI